MSEESKTTTTSADPAPPTTEEVDRTIHEARQIAGLTMKLYQSLGAVLEAEGKMSHADVNATLLTAVALVLPALVVLSLESGYEAEALDKAFGVSRSTLTAMLKTKADVLAGKIKPALDLSGTVPAGRA